MTRRRRDSQDDADSTYEPVHLARGDPNYERRKRERPSVVSAPVDSARLTTSLTDGTVHMLDDWYDLIVVVGTLESTSGLQTFRVNKYALRLASEPFSAMLFRSFAESSTAKLFLENDSSTAFSIVFHICHYKYDKLADTISDKDLHDLAILCDKYDLSMIVAPIVRWKHWLSSHKIESMRLEDRDLNHWLYVAFLFKSELEYDFLVNLFAMTASFDQNGSLWYMQGSLKDKLSDDLPSQILCKSICSPAG